MCESVELKAKDKNDGERNAVSNNSEGEPRKKEKKSGLIIPSPTKKL